MAGRAATAARVVPAIHVFEWIGAKKDVDARDEPGHDEPKTETTGLKRPTR